MIDTRHIFALFYLFTFAGNSQGSDMEVEDSPVEESFLKTLSQAQEELLVHLCQARKKAMDIQSQARDQAEQILQKAQQEAERLASSVTEDLEESEEKEQEDRIAESKIQAMALEQRAQRRLKEASAYIYARVFLKEKR